jgi:TonB family protein
MNIEQNPGTDGADLQTANERFKRGNDGRIAVMVLASVALHFAVFQFFPDLQAADLSVDGDEITAIELPPEVRIPPPPEQIARPARPRVAAAAVAEDITIAATTFEENPVDNLPPPPAGADPSEVPSYIARDIEPRLENSREIRDQLRKQYPPDLRDSGIGGRVVLWVFVEEDGSPGAFRVQESSGHMKLDQAAERIAERMVFSPAMLRDRPVAVWIAMPITFETVRG